MSDDLEKLLAEVRKNINDNKQFLDNFADESVDVDLDADCETLSEDDLEEL